MLLSKGRNGSVVEKLQSIVDVVKRSEEARTQSQPSSHEEGQQQADPVSEDSKLTYCEKVLRRDRHY